MSPVPARRFRRLQGLFAGLWGVMLGWPVQAGELPPPPSSLESMADAQLFLELVINQMNTGKVVAVEQRAGRLFMPLQTLQDAGIKLPQGLGGEVDLQSLPDLHSDYDSQGQRLLLDVPPDWLPEQFIGSRQAYPRTRR